MKLRLVASSVIVALLAIVSPSLRSQTPNPDWTIYSPYLDLRISVSAAYAGAITSLKYGGVNIVDNHDHGRQIQSSISFNGKFENYNPNEAGTLEDEDWETTSDLLGLSIPASNRLMTTTDMAYWWIRSGPAAQPYAVPYSNAQPNGQFTQFWMQKDVTIGPPGLAANVIEYLNTYQPSATTPPEAVFSSDATVSAWLVPNFTEVFSYDLATRQLLQHEGASGADDMVKVLNWPNSPIGELMFALYSPENVQPWEGSGFTWALPSIFGTTSVLWTNNRTSNPLPQSYRTYMAVGNRGDVMNGLNSLDLKFASLDPDVFSWREYLALNPDLAPYIQGDPQRWLRDHWLSNGVGEGRTASYRFALGRYRNLNSDQWSKSNQAVIEHYIQEGRKQGRSTSPRAEGGLQHTLVRSPEQDFVPVRVSGGNSSGQLGNGTTTRTASPIRLPNFGTGQRPTDIAVGDFTSFAVLADGTVWMWGSNSNGARGNGTFGGPNQLTPVQVPGLPPIVVPSTKDRHVVAAGQNAYAVVDYNGSVWTWGYGGNGQLGRGNANSYYTPGKVQKSSGGDLTGIVSIAVSGANMMAALDIDGRVWTWGYNGYGTLGNNTTTTRYTADKVQTAGGAILGGITQIVTGGSFCLALQRNGQIVGWGQNNYGQLGDNTMTNRLGAVTVLIPLYDHKIDKIAVGGYHALAHSDYDGRIYVWGYNGYGALGLPPGYPVNNPSPTALPVSDATSNITDLGAGSFFSFLIRANTTERKLFGFGDNQSGQLGLNHYMTQTTPALTSF